MKFVKTAAAALLALILLLIPILSAADPIDSTYIPGSDKWTIPYYAVPVVINADPRNVTIDSTWGDKQFTVDQKMLTQGGYGQSTGWGNLWVNNDQSTGLPYQPGSTPFDVWMGWETGYFDLAVLLKNHKNYNSINDGGLWYGDCLQFQIGANVNGTRYEYGIARGSGMFPNNLSYEWYPDEKEAPLQQNTEYTINTSGSTTLYLLKLPLAKFGLTDASQWTQGFSFPFALCLHFYDANDNTGVTPLGYFMEWASGVVGGTTEKTLNTAATITLGGPPPTQPQLGDVNGDGKIDTVDARMILQYAVRKITFNNSQQTLADVNKDGRVDTVDARMVLQIVVGKITAFTPLA